MYVMILTVDSPIQNVFCTALEVAAENGFTATVERLLVGGANINHQNKVTCILLLEVLTT